MGCLDPAISSRARESHGHPKGFNGENYKDALESSTEVCTGDSGKDLLVGISKGSSWDPMGI